ncbi:MAG: 30S ribosomal protein S12 methylthiotransferase RimO [Bacteroidales bacterium]|nr:30S ribosomal protein S12 methylthiotransferase RimO [Bacteroidales bacterium]MCF8457338.1 30S ribosomal protein S12 methylthiotransferase RimO [Bacteroidales bacterium]
MKPKKINIVTLGCSKNLVDSQVLAGQLQKNNIELLHDSNDLSARTVVINTCGFILDAKQESIDNILSFAEEKRAGNIDHLFVMGCLSERYKDALRKEMPEVDEFFGVNNLREIIEILDADYKKELLGERQLTNPGHYAYLKISEGCDRSCSFCAIPLIRGKHISKPIEKIISEANYLASIGVKELILIAQDLTYYGIDIYKKQALAELLLELDKIESIEWIRLHYAYPTSFPTDILPIMRLSSKICNYLDIPFQHINSRILADMKRNIDKENTLQLIKKFRKEIPGIALRTTILVGFPGETVEDFEELKEFVKETRFDRLGVFTYSEEDDTHAAIHLKDDVPEKEKQRRADEIMLLQQDISLEINTEKIGRTFKVIIDRREGDQVIGRTEFDSVEVDNEVVIEDPSASIQIGNFYKVEIIDATEFDLIGIWNYD